ncbi:MAG: pyruvate formate lyase family protein [bacterium]
MIEITKIALSDKTQHLRDWAMTTGQHYGYQDALRRDVMQYQIIVKSDAELSHVERCAQGFAGMLKQIPLFIGNDDLIAGHFTPPSSNAEEQELRNELVLLTNSLQLPMMDYPSTLRNSLDELLQAYTKSAWIGGVGRGHSNINYGRVLQEGLQSLALEVEDNANILSNKDNAAYCQAMGTTLRGVIHFAERHANYADELGKDASQCRAAELNRIAAACRKVPANPATTFFEALQSFWMVYLALGMSESPSANSLGNLDRYLFPYYENDIKNGTLTESEADELLAQFLIKCGSYAEGQTITLGGLSPDGSDATNALTLKILYLIREIGLPEPIVGLRIHDNTPDEVWDAATALTAAGFGQPSYYYEPACRAMMKTRNIPPCDQEAMAINSCMGVVVAGAEVSDMWGGIVNLPLCLEMAVSRGIKADGTVLPEFVALCPDDYHSIDDLYQAYQRIQNHVIKIIIDKYRIDCDYHAEWYPNPFLSALLDDCRVRGLDRLAGGPRYHSVIIEGIGWANVSDSLIAINETVFKRKNINLTALLEDVRNDFQDAPELLANLRECIKYGNGEEIADSLAVKVVSSFAEAVASNRKEGEFREYLPSLHTLNQHIYAGASAPVSFDGRRYGAPLNKQLGPSSWIQPSSPTSVLISAAAIPIASLPGGQALDISIPSNLLNTAKGCQQFRALINTYFSLGGADLQINNISTDELRAAQEKPDAFRHLIVRIAGYSEFFIKLDHSQQNDIIERVSVGL